MVEEPAKFIGDISIANQVYNPFTTGGHHLVERNPTTDATLW